MSRAETRSCKITTCPTALTASGRDGLTGSILATKDQGVAHRPWLRFNMRCCHE